VRSSTIFLVGEFLLTSFEDLEYIAEVKDKLSRINHGISSGTLDLIYSDYLLEEDIARKAEDRAFLDEIVRLYSPELALSRKPLLPVPNADDSSGDIVLGKIIQGEEELWDFAIPAHELNQGHILITSRSGHGKTTLLMRIVSQLLENETPFLITDYKRDFRGLTKEYPDLLVLSNRNLRINFLRPPPGVSIEEWKQQFLNIFSHVEGVWSGSTQFLLRHLDRVYAEKGKRATIADLKEELETDTPNLRRMRDYWSAVYTRIYGLHSKLGPVVECEEGLDIEKLLNRPMVLELDGFGGFEDQNLLILYFFFWIYAYRKAHRHRGTARHWIIIDEAKRVFPASEQYSSTTREYSHISPTDIIVDEIRDFSEILVAADNEVSKLSNSIISQSYVKIIGNVAGRDLDIISEAINLDDAERDCIPMLERGEWIGKLASRYTKPFIIKTEDFPVDKDVANEELEKRMQPLLQELILKTANESDSVSSQETDEIKVTKSAPDRLRVKLPTLSEDAWTLLLNVKNHPFKGLSGRYKSLNLSGRRATSAKKELIENGLVREVSVPLGNYRPVKFLALTPIAIHSLENVGHDVRLWKHTQGQFRHQLYTILIGYSYRRAGFQTYIEKTLRNGRRVDVLTIIQEKKVAIEVETGISVDIENKLKALEEVDELVIITDEQTKVRTVKEAIQDVPPDRVRVFHITDYLRYLKTNYNIESNGRTSKNSQKSNSNPDSGNKAGKKRK
jgi:hypothetical protein